MNKGIEKKNIRRLFNKDHSIKYHEWFTFISLKSDYNDRGGLGRNGKFKKDLIGKKFVCSGTQILNATDSPWKKKRDDSIETIKCLDNGEFYKFKRDVLFAMKPVIDITKNPNWEK